MALTFLELLTRLAARENQAWADVPEAKKRQYVTEVNAALRWIWRDDDPHFAWPWTVDDKTTTPSSGLITAATLSDTGDGSWCSLWTVDPRTYESLAVPVIANSDHDGVHVLDGTTSVFAFYRKAVPQGTYASGGSYSTPASIPSLLLDVVTLKALANRLANLKDWEGLNALMKSEGNPNEVRDRWKDATLNNPPPWGQHTLAIATAAT